MQLAFPSGGSYSTCKMTQECASDTERFCNSIVLIINCLSLLFWETLSFLQIRGRGRGGAFVLGDTRGSGRFQLEDWVYCLITPQSLVSFSVEDIKRCNRGHKYSGGSLLFCWSGHQVLYCSQDETQNSHCQLCTLVSYSTTAFISSCINGDDKLLRFLLP